MRLRIQIAVGLTVAVALALTLTQTFRRDDAEEAPSAPAAEVVTDGASVREGWLSPARQPGLAAPPPFPAVATNVRPTSGTNWLESLFSPGGELPPLPQEVIESWLASGRTNAQDLLALRQAGCGKDYFLLALTNFPNDPRVLLLATVLGDGPEAQRERLNRFQAAAPDNSLAAYLSARDHFKNSRPEQALADLAAASAKPRFDDYVLEAILNTEELFLQAGKSPAEAKALGTTTALMPHLAQLKGLAQDMAALQGQYLAAGDPESAERLAQLGLQLGERLATGEGSTTLIGQLVGMSVERMVLKPLDPARDYDFLPGTVSDYLAQLDARKAAVRDNSQYFEEWMRGATPAEITSYFDRLKLYGEAEALKWMRQRLGKP